jgi:Domain of unknown function (DUF4304)
MEEILVTDADKFFAKVLKGLHPLFKQNGFRKSGQNFILESPECWVVINLQKSRWSDLDEKTFYVNVAATAKRLLEFEHEPIDKAPVHWKCAWNIRAEQLAPEPKIQQWTVRDENSVQEALDYLLILIGQFVIPKVKGMLSEKDLLCMWKDDARLGYTNLKAKSVLLAAQVNGAELESTLRRLKEEFGTSVVADGVAKHIAALQKEFPGSVENLHL